VPPQSWKVGGVLVMKAGHAATMLSYPGAYLCEFHALSRSWLVADQPRMSCTP
jgi:hypothetical protein